MKTIIKKFFPGLVSLRNRVYNYVAHYRFKGKPTEEVFEAIYRENHWNDQESKSGTGSNKKNTQVTVQIVNSVIKELSIRSMLDVPCGDFNWMQEVQLENVQYTGADIVGDLIDKNTRT